MRTSPEAVLRTRAPKLLALCLSLWFAIGTTEAPAYSIEVRCFSDEPGGETIRTSTTDSFVQCSQLVTKTSYQDVHNALGTTAASSDIVNRTLGSSSTAYRNATYARAHIKESLHITGFAGPSTQIKFYLHVTGHFEGTGYGSPGVNLMTLLNMNHQSFAVQYEYGPDVTMAAEPVIQDLSPDTRLYIQKIGPNVLEYTMERTVTVLDSFPFIDVNVQLLTWAATDYNGVEYTNSFFGHTGGMFASTEPGIIITSDSGHPFPKGAAPVIDDQDDSDGDGVLDDQDTCPEIANPDQADGDGDGIGDVCEPDSDGDGVIDDLDNCMSTPNPDQQDTDGDGQGNACDLDDDGDGADDDADNCPLVANGDQADFDHDGQGDACDADVDGDGLNDAEDQCLGTAAGEVTDAVGCSIAQLAPCENPSGWKNHGAYVSAVAKAAENFLDLGLITQAQKDAIIAAAGASQCGQQR